MNINQLQTLIRHLYCAALSGQGLISQHCPTDREIDKALMASIVKGIRMGQSSDDIAEQLGIEPDLVDAVKSELRNRYVPTMIWGEAGIGKSETVRGAADDLNIGFIDLRLGQLEPGDLLGQPRSEKVYPCVYDWETNAPPEVLAMRFSQSHLYRYIMENHRETTEGLTPGQVIDQAVKLAEGPNYRHLVDFQTVYATPSWFPAPGTHGILFLDELNRSHEDVRAAIFQLILDRRMHTLQLPRGWIIISANNPPSRDYGEVDEMNDKAFRSRFLHVVLEPTAEEWLQYAQDAGISPTIRSVIRMNSKMLGLQSISCVPDSVPTPRTWVMLNNIMDGLDPRLVLEVASGLVGPVAAAAWAKLRDVQNPPVAATELMMDYSRVRPRLFKFLKHPDPQYTETGEKVIDESTGQHAVVFRPRTDMMAVTFDDLTSHISERALTPQESAQVIQFVEDSFKSTSDGGLGIKDIAYQYVKFWAEMPGGKDILKASTGNLRSVLIEAGMSSEVARAGGRSRTRRRRRPLFETMQGLSPALPAPRISIGDWAFGAAEAELEAAYAVAG